MSRVQHRIRLSCDTSTIDAGLSATECDGVRKLRPFCRNISTTAITSGAGEPVIADSSAMLVGRRTPRSSENVSVSVLNTCSTSRSRPAAVAC